jgi:hypothetical protein
MVPYQHQQRKVKDIGFNDNRVTDGLSVPANSAPARPLVNNGFHNQYKRNVILANKFHKYLSEYKPNNHNQHFHKLNEIGLQKAYTSPNFLYKHHDTLYIGGTQTGRDAYDDLKIPFGLTRYSKRYIDAEKVIDKHPLISHLVGH